MTSPYWDYVLCSLVSVKNPYCKLWPLNFIILWPFEREQKSLNEGILIFCLSPSVFWDIARRWVNIDDSEQHIVPISKGPAIHATSQNNEDLKPATAEVLNLFVGISYI